MASAKMEKTPGTAAKTSAALANLEQALVAAGPTGTQDWEAYRQILSAIGQVASLVSYAGSVDLSVTTTAPVM